MDLEIITYDIESMVQHLHHLFDIRCKEKGLTFSISLDKEVNVLLKGDELRIQQILINLIGNAIKFTKQGNVKLIIKLSDSHESLRFEILDDGIGISAKKLPLLFNSFQQVESSTTRQYGGTGLGLAISKQLVELMHGDIGVESVFGEGSCFWFDIPYIISHEKLTEKSTIDEETRISNTSAKILLAEDNEVNQMVVVGLLKKSGLKNVDIVDNGNKAVQQLVKEDYDLVLMDVQMPECNGLDACRQIRGTSGYADYGSTVRNPKIPIIALTANAMQSDVEDCLEAGMDSHLGKPIDKLSLETELKKWLGSEAI